jgi:hypothetical protein
MNADETKKMQEARAEYTRRMDYLRQQQADTVRDFLAQEEKRGEDVDNGDGEEN